jgi:GTP diphosphokinase / guanosine-3',5'-bis(diphosphate) 3'-diphosphatase
VRKRLQVVKAAAKSERAKLVKLADKICNLRDIAATPPAAWSVARRRMYRLKTDTPQCTISLQ